jgi:hypothetical protein
MLSGFECDDDRTGWLAGLVLWSVGAAAGCLFAAATLEPALAHWQVLALAAIVSLVSLGLRLPVIESNCTDRVWLVHAAWMFALFAQINWAGFLAARSASGTIAAEAILVCLGLEVWLLVRSLAQGELPWIQQFFSGNVQLVSVQLGNVASVSHTLPLGAPLSTLAAIPTEIEDEGEGDIRREYVDGYDENGQRYLSGTVRLQLEEQQRTETFTLSFCPALDRIADVQLECDSEDVTAKVEHATETGARISIRRTNISHAAVVSVDWFATASESSAHSANLP